VEKEGRDQEVVNRKKYGFGEVYGRFSAVEDMVERNLAMEYCSLEGFFSQEPETDDQSKLSFQREKNGCFEFDLIREKRDPNTFQKRIELLKPNIRVMNNGNELKRIHLSFMELMFVCENGPASFAEPFLKDGEPKVPKVPEPPASVSSQESDEFYDEIPIIELHPLLNDPNFKLEDWSDNISFKFQDYEVVISNYDVKFMKKNNLEKYGFGEEDRFSPIFSKKWTFKQFYFQFYQMQKDSEREMALEVYFNTMNGQHTPNDLFNDERTMEIARKLGYALMTTPGVSKYVIFPDEKDGEKRMDTLMQDEEESFTTRSLVSTRLN